MEGLQGGIQSQDSRKAWFLDPRSLFRNGWATSIAKSFRLGWVPHSEEGVNP